jgi:tetratricopeptide (TPR) repeat protein
VSLLLTFVAGVGTMLAAGQVQARATAADLRAQAFEAAYNLDYREAVELFDRALKVNPNDSATHRARASAEWLHIIFRRGSITVDQYLGEFQRRDVAMEKPPVESAVLFAQHANRALELAEQVLEKNDRDVQALYDAGAAVGLLASYSATVEGRILGAFRDAKRAFDSHERVLELDPARKDAGLIVGTYRYLVSKLSLPARWMAYLVGFGGDGDLGLRMVEEAAATPSAAQVDAQFALMLLYNREKRYDEAQRVIRLLMDRFPRNRILWLEGGATAFRAGRLDEAERLLTAGIDRLATDARERAFGEEATWYYKRGTARAALRKTATARLDLERALALPARDWVHARAHLEVGKLEDLTGRRTDAVRSYERARVLARTGNDPETDQAASTLIGTAYR